MDAPVEPLDPWTAEGGRTLRMLKHPSRSRNLRFRAPTSYGPLGTLLLVVFGGDYRRCRTCGTVYEATSDFFGHTPSGNLRHVCDRCRAATTRRWDAANPDRVRERMARRRSAEAAAGAEPTPLEKARLRRHLGDCCYYCNTPLCGGGDLDHKVSVQRGGPNSIGNWAWACHRCNKDKREKSVPEFLAWRRKFSLPIRLGIPEDADLNAVS